MLSNTECTRWLQLRLPPVRISAHREQADGRRPRLVSVAELNGLILATASSADEDIVYRLQGRTRYAMPVANRALVRYAADGLAACRVKDVAVAVSPETVADVQDLIGEGERFGARYRYLELRDSDSTLDALLAAREVLGDEQPLVVHSGDALVTSGLLGVIADYERTHPDVLAVSDPTRSHRTTSVVGSRSGARHTRALDGFDRFWPAAVLGPTVLRDLKDAMAGTDPIGGEVVSLAEKRVSVIEHALAGCWCYSGDCDRLLEANRMILDELPHSAVEPERHTVRVDGRAFIHPTARLERTTIRGPAVIGGDAEISDTFVGPYTSIGAGARLEGAEVEHSIVLGGAAIRHLGHRLEASVIGADAEIARDYRMPTAVRVQLGRGSRVMLA